MAREGTFGMKRIGGGVLACLLFLAGCAATPPGPATSGHAGGISLNSQMIDTSGTFAKGFSRDEALRLLELCLNLNNPNDGPAYAADTSAWAPVYPNAVTTQADVLGPGDNAWKLWRSTTEPNTYAIVVRGTVAEQVSIVEDVIATSVAQPARIQAWPDGYLEFTLAQTPGSQTHLGFTDGLAALMFAQDKGILAQLAQVPAGSHIYITGHSQGAAVAALAHAFLHYAINDPSDRYGLAKRNYSLKSYFFAQPKPGNWQFGMDFARIASSHGTAFVVNNTLDWVTQVPLAVEFLDEPGSDLLTPLAKTAATRNRVLELNQLEAAIRAAEQAVNLAMALRAKLANDTGAFTARTLQRATGLLDRRWMIPGTAVVLAADSINYVSVGNIVPLIGDNPCVPPMPGGSTDDPLCQHHLPTYRTLMKAQLSGP